MIYKKAEIHNIAELKNNDDGSVSWLRIPQNVYDALEVTELGRSMAENSTGVELRFIIKSGNAVIRMSSPDGGRFHVYRGGIQGCWYDHERNKSIDEKPRDYIIEPNENSERLKTISEMSGYSWDSDVIRVIFDKGKIKLYDISGDIALPTVSQMPKRTLLCYGSSITHGSNALDMSHSWVSALAHDLNMDAWNLGMAGSCALEPEFARYIASEGENGKWDLAILELGINVLLWDKQKILDRSKNIICQIAGRNPEKIVVVISPFYYCSEDLDKDRNGDKWRRLLKQVTDELKYPNVVYINGLDIIDNMSYMSADEVHPNIKGMARIAEYLSKALKL